MARPLLLDAFCCEGGAGVGYARAGFDVVGVDLKPRPNYPFPIIEADAVDFIRTNGREFEAIHTSPPCQFYSVITNHATRDRHPDLIPATRDALRAVDRPYVIENVTGARKALIDPVRLCGSAFDLKVQRHRYFETNFDATGVTCAHAAQGQVVGVYGYRERVGPYRRPDGTNRGRKAKSEEEASAALGGVPWMTWHGMTQCIPPAYAEHIGQQLMKAVLARR